MSDQVVQQSPTAAAGARAVDQVLLGLADGSYVLSTPEGAVAECGAGVGALLGTPPESLAGRPTADALVPGADVATRAAFDALLRGDGAAPRALRAVTASGEPRSLSFLVVAVPLALGWEFTSLLSELDSRDPATWHLEALRLRHGRALEAIERVCHSGEQPDAGARLAGILIVVGDVGAPPLQRADVGRRMAERRDAARAAAEAARRAAAADGLAGGSELGDLVERARVLRERVEEAEREAAVAIAEREQALAQLAAGQAELERRQADDGRAGELAAERDEARARARAAEEQAAQLRAAADAARAETADLREQLAAARAQLDETRAELEATRAQLVENLAAAQGARAAARAIRAEFAFDGAGDGGAASAAATADAGAAAGGALELPAAAPGEAVALIGLDGAFERLDDAFCSLLGHREEELRLARWPSVIDRENHAEHAELARALRAGEIDSAAVETVYMHAGGLLVPVAGTVSLHRPAGGEPHFLLRADVGRTSGVLL